MQLGVAFISPKNVEMPLQVDWRDQGAVTPIKNQGQCGSCYAFAAIGALEGQQFRNSGQLISFSEQNLVDCSGHEGNSGCDGGLVDRAFQYMHENMGIDTEDSYPYTGVSGSCQYSPSSSPIRVKGFVDLPKGDEIKLAEAVATIGPVAVAIDASQRSFQFLGKGVYSDDNCSSETLDHAVLVVGYGTEEDGTAYWLAKNSWGTIWGDEGYFKVARNRDNHCGLASMASYPLLESSPKYWMAQGRYKH